MSTEPLLEIAEAAEILGLHPSTLRRWADAGKIAHIRTMSGRRRFERAVVEHIAADMAQSPQLSAEQIESTSLDYARRRSQDFNLRQDWFARLSDEQALVFRYGGERLLALLAQYTSQKGQPDAVLEEAQGIVTGYAKLSSRVGLSLAQATQTFLFFRRSVLESMQSTAEFSGVDGPHPFLRASDFFDALLIAMIENYPAAARDGTA